MNKKLIAENIRTDVDKQIYDQFPKLKSRLTFIANKLFSGHYIINGDYNLSRGELETLAENDYIERYDIDDYIKEQNKSK